MLTKLILLFLVFTNLYANTTLKSTYYVDSDDIYISSLINNISEDKIIYKFAPNKHVKRVKSKELIKTLKKYGYHDVNSKSRYVKFVKNSPIDSSIIASHLKKYYKTRYKNINIKHLHLRPRSYIDELPMNYTVDIRKKSYLSKDGILSIKTAQNKRMFFNYSIDAELVVYYSKHKIKKGTPLLNMNLRKKTVVLDRFMAKPIQILELNSYEAKHTIRQNSIITTRDIIGLSLVKTNASVNVFLNSNNMSIGFTAKSLQNGKLNDIITLKQANGKKIKVRVVGKNRAEMQ